MPFLLFKSQSAELYLVIFILSAPELSKFSLTASSEREDDIRGTDKTRNNFSLSSIDLRIKTPTTRSCDLSVYCFSLKIIQPNCLKGYLENSNQKKYIKILFKSSQCRQNSLERKNDSSLSYWFWRSDTKSKFEIQRCRFSTVCLVPKLALTNTQCKERGIDLCIQADKNVPLECISVSLNVTSPLKRKHQCSKTTSELFHQEQKLDGKHTEPKSKLFDFIRYLFYGDHKGKAEIALATYPHKINIMSKNNLENSNQKPVVERNLILRTHVIVKKMKIGNKITHRLKMSKAARAASRFSKIINQKPVLQKVHPNLKPRKNTQFFKEFKKLLFELKDLKDVGVKNKRLKKSNTNSDISTNDIVSYIADSSDHHRNIEHQKSENVVLSTKQLTRFPRHQALNLTKRSSGLDEAQDLAILMQDENDVDKEKIAEMIASDFASSLGMDKPVASSGTGSKMEHDFAKFDSALKDLKAEKEKEKTGIDLVETLASKEAQENIHMRRLRTDVAKLEKKLLKATVDLDKANVDYDANTNPKMAQMLSARKADAEEAAKKLKLNLKKLKETYKSMKQETAAREPKQPQRKLHGLVVIDPMWGDWSPWSKCSADCGNGGFTMRNRDCDTLPDVPCTGITFDMKPCNAGLRCEAEWQDWGDWGPCSVSCGKGVRARSRICMTGDKEVSCKGESSKLEKCNLPVCESPVPAIVIPASDNSGSVASAGGPVVVVGAGAAALGASKGIPKPPMVMAPKGVEAQKTFPYSWGMWGEWSSCSKSCGEGRQRRIRYCLDDSKTSPIRVFKKHCGGVEQQSRNCMGSCNGAPVAAAAMVGGAAAAVDYGDMAEGAAVIERDGELGPRVLTSGEGEALADRGVVVSGGQGGTKVITLQEKREEKEEDSDLSAETVIFIILLILCVILIIIGFCIWLFSRIEETQMKSKMKSMQTLDADDTDGGAPVYGVIKPAKKLGPPNKRQNQSDSDPDDSDSRKRRGGKKRRRKNLPDDMSPSFEDETGQKTPQGGDPSSVLPSPTKGFLSRWFKASKAGKSASPTEDKSEPPTDGQSPTPSEPESKKMFSWFSSKDTAKPLADQAGSGKMEEEFESGVSSTEEESGDRTESTGDNGDLTDRGDLQVDVFSSDETSTGESEVSYMESSPELGDPYELQHDDLIKKLELLAFQSDELEPGPSTLTIEVAAENLPQAGWVMEEQDVFHDPAVEDSPLVSSYDTASSTTGTYLSYSSPTPQEETAGEEVTSDYSSDATTTTTTARPETYSTDDTISSHSGVDGTETDVSEDMGDIEDSLSKKDTRWENVLMPIWEERTPELISPLSYRTGSSTDSLKTVVYPDKELRTVQDVGQQYDSVKLGSQQDLFQECNVVHQETNYETPYHTARGDEEDEKQEQAAHLSSSAKQTGREKSMTNLSEEAGLQSREPSTLWLSALISESDKKLNEIEKEIDHVLTDECHLPVEPESLTLQAHGSGAEKAGDNINYVPWNEDDTRSDVNASELTDLSVGASAEYLREEIQKQAADHWISSAEIAEAGTGENSEVVFKSDLDEAALQLSPGLSYEEKKRNVLKTLTETPPLLSSLSRAESLSHTSQGSSSAGLVSMSQQSLSDPRSTKYNSANNTGSAAYYMLMEQSKNQDTSSWTTGDTSVDNEADAAEMDYRERAKSNNTTANRRMTDESSTSTRSFRNDKLKGRTNAGDSCNMGKKFRFGGQDGNKQHERAADAEREMCPRNYAKGLPKPTVIRPTPDSSTDRNTRSVRFADEDKTSMIDDLTNQIALNLTKELSQAMKTKSAPKQRTIISASQISAMETANKIGLIPGKSPALRFDLGVKGHGMPATKKFKEAKSADDFREKEAANLSEILNEELDKFLDSTKSLTATDPAEIQIDWNQCQGKKQQQGKTLSGVQSHLPTQVIPPAYFHCGRTNTSRMAALAANVKQPMENSTVNLGKITHQILNSGQAGLPVSKMSHAGRMTAAPLQKPDPISCDKPGVTRRCYETQCAPAARSTGNQFSQMGQTVPVQPGSVSASGTQEFDTKVPGVSKTSSTRPNDLQQLTHPQPFGIHHTVKKHPVVFQQTMMNKPLVTHTDKPEPFTQLKSNTGEFLINQCVTSQPYAPSQQFLTMAPPSQLESDKTLSLSKFLTIQQSQIDSDQEVYNTPNYSPIAPDSQRQICAPREVPSQLLQTPSCSQQLPTPRRSHGVNEIKLDGSLVSQWLGVKGGPTQTLTDLHGAPGQMSCMINTMNTPPSTQAGLNESFNTAPDTPGSTTSWRSAKSGQSCEKSSQLHLSVAQNLPGNILPAKFTETQEPISSDQYKPLLSNLSLTHSAGLKQYASEPQRLHQASWAFRQVNKTHDSIHLPEHLSQISSKAEQSDRPSSGSSLHTVMSRSQGEQVTPSLSGQTEMSEKFHSCVFSDKASRHRSPPVLAQEFEEVKGLHHFTKPVGDIISFRSARSNGAPEDMTAGSYQLDRTQNKCSVSVDESKSTVGDHRRRDKVQSISVLRTDTEESQKTLHQFRKANRERSALSLTTASSTAKMATPWGDSFNDVASLHADTPLATSTGSSFIQACLGNQGSGARIMENKSTSISSNSTKYLSKPGSDVGNSTQYLSQSSLDSNVTTETKSQTTPSSDVGTSTKYLSQSQLSSDWDTSAKSITAPNSDVEFSTKSVSTPKSDVEISTKSTSTPNSDVGNPTKYLSVWKLNLEWESSKEKTDISLPNTGTTTAGPYLSLPTPSIRDHLQGIMSDTHEEISDISTEETVDGFRPYSDSHLYDADIIQIKRGCTSENLYRCITHPTMPVKNRRLTYTSDSPGALRKPVGHPVYPTVSQGEMAGHQGAGDFQTSSSSDSSTSYPSSCDRGSDLKASHLEMKASHRTPISKFKDCYDDFSSVLPTSSEVKISRNDLSAISSSCFSSFSDFSWDQKNFITFPLDHEAVRESTILKQALDTTSCSLIKKDVNILASETIAHPKVTHSESKKITGIQSPMLTPLNLGLSESSAWQDDGQEEVEPEKPSDPNDEMSFQHMTSLSACSASLIHRLSEGTSQFGTKDSEGFDMDTISLEYQISPSEEDTARVTQLNLVSDSSRAAGTAPVLVLAAPSTLSALDQSKVSFVKWPDVESSRVLEKSFRTCHSLKPQSKVAEFVKPIGPVGLQRKQISDTRFPIKLKSNDSRKRSDHTSQSQSRSSDLFQRQIQWSPLVDFAEPSEENLEFPSGNFQSYPESCRESDPGALKGMGDLWLIKSSITDTVIPEAHKFEELNIGLELETPRHFSRQPSMFHKSGLAETLYRTEEGEFRVEVTGWTSQKDNDKNSESNTLSDVSSMVFDKSSLWHGYCMSKNPEGKDHVLEKIEENSKTNLTDVFTEIQSLNQLVEYKDILKSSASNLACGTAEANQVFEKTSSPVSETLGESSAEQSWAGETKKESWLSSEQDHIGRTQLFEPHTALHENLCLDITRQQSEISSIPLKNKSEQATDRVKATVMKDGTSYYPETNSSRQESSTLDKVPPISTSLSSHRTLPTSVPTEREKVSSHESASAHKKISREALAATQQVKSHGPSLKSKGRPAVDEEGAVEPHKFTKSSASTVASSKETKQSDTYKLMTPTLYRVPVKTSDVVAQLSGSVCCKESPDTLHPGTGCHHPEGKGGTTQAINLSLLHTTDSARLVHPRFDFSKVMDHKVQSPNGRDNTVDSPDVRDNTVDSLNVNDHTVDSPDVRDNTVYSPDVIDHTIASPDVRDNTVDSPDVIDHTVDSPDVRYHTVESPDVRDNTVDSLDVRDHTVESPDVRDHTVDSPDVRYHTVESPDVRDHIVESPDVRGHTVESPDVRDHTVESPDVRDHTVESPDVRDHIVESPDVRDHIVESPDVRYHTVESPDVRDHTVDSPDVRDHTVDSSDVRDHIVDSPDVRDHTVDSPDVRDHTVDSPDVRDHTVDSPDVRDHTVDSPDVRDHTVDSPDVRDHTVDSPDVRDHTVDSPDVRDHTVDSPDVRDHIVDSPDVRDHTVDSPDVRDHIVDSPDVRDHTVDSPDVRDHTVDSPDVRDHIVETFKYGVDTWRDSSAKSETSESLDNTFPRPSRKNTQLTKSSFTLTRHSVIFDQLISESGSGSNDIEAQGDDFVSPGAFQGMKLAEGDKEYKGEWAPRVKLANLNSNTEQASTRLISLRSANEPRGNKPTCLISTTMPEKNKPMCLRSPSEPEKNSPICLKSPSEPAKDRPICSKSTTEPAKDRPICLKSTTEPAKDRPICLISTTEPAKDRPICLKSTTEPAKDRPICLKSTTKPAKDGPICLKSTNEPAKDRPICLKSTTEPAKHRPICLKSTTEPAKDRPICLKSTTEPAKDRPICLKSTTEPTKDRPICLKSTTETPNRRTKLASNRLNHLKSEEDQPTKRIQLIKPDKVQKKIYDKRIQLVKVGHHAEKPGGHPSLQMRSSHGKPSCPRVRLNTVSTPFTARVQLVRDVNYNTKAVTQVYEDCSNPPQGLGLNMDGSPDSDRSWSGRDISVRLVYETVTSETHQVRRIELETDHSPLQEDSECYANTTEIESECSMSSAHCHRSGVSFLEPGENRQVHYEHSRAVSQCAIAVDYSPSQPLLSDPYGSEQFDMSSEQVDVSSQSDFHVPSAMHVDQRDLLYRTFPTQTRARNHFYDDSPKLLSPFKERHHAHQKQWISAQRTRKSFTSESTSSLPSKYTTNDKLNSEAHPDVRDSSDCFDFCIEGSRHHGLSSHSRSFIAVSESINASKHQLGEVDQFAQSRTRKSSRRPHSLKLSPLDGSLTENSSTMSLKRQFCAGRSEYCTDDEISDSSSQSDTNDFCTEAQSPSQVSCVSQQFHQGTSLMDFQIHRRDERTDWMNRFEDYSANYSPSFIKLPANRVEEVHTENQSYSDSSSGNRCNRSHLSLAQATDAVVASSSCDLNSSSQPIRGCAEVAADHKSNPEANLSATNGNFQRKSRRHHCSKSHSKK